MTAALALSDAAYFLRDGYPMLRVRVEGREAELLSECKPTLHSAGIVFLGSGFDDLVPPIDFLPPGQEGGEPLRLEGFSRDGRLFRLYDAFGRACNDGSFRTGPVEIPD